MFTIEPFVGAIPLRFGMSQKEVTSLIGPPTRSFTGAFGEACEEYTSLSMNLAYHSKTQRLNELVFEPGSKLYFNGQDLFDCPDVISFLKRDDRNPKKAVGMVFFLKLGIRLSGFHDGDEAQKAIGITPAGHWDEYMDDFEEM